MIKAMGEKNFWSIEGNKIYKDPKVPVCFSWLFTCFLEIYNLSKESITWTDISSYAIMRNIKFTQIEIDYLLKINSWASSKIKEMRDEEQ